jgi:hypothetical protein
MGPAAQAAYMANMPAGPPPEGQVSNFINPPSQQNTIIAVSTVLMFLTLAFVSLRLYSTFCITRSTGMEDCKI